MDEQELCRKRLLDLSRQAERKGIVIFSDFLNLNEQNIFHAIQSSLPTQAALSGGYENAERQMVAFIPDALYYDWAYPIVCLRIVPQYPKFAKPMSHRDVLGSVMHLGIDRGRIGDILCKEDACYLFCAESIHGFLLDELTQIRNNAVSLSVMDETQSLAVSATFREESDQIASNRIDAIIARAYHLSRSEAASYLAAEKVFINGRCITNCNQSCESGAIVSVRGKGRFVFETDNATSKKGKLKVRFRMYV
jgi:RNA-binding protein YlmH